ncbi:Predicted metal-dependent phosphoesterase TrpH, contains PHP domain [Halopelagius inordinatus]|uniref:Predicted metal-dependent phosphoesterase TrpH, contains PHP domain n=1 Tax=Halopelagius inordinatus TaxID=553467 RepID=A0A1I2T0R4_9EURY|nr:PHP domain-containing protein [Halopelagius inordinatus]SFG56767.1 Predicted metal-dependent phosphoesterase TrpH, contains PHP domain [Halopelagius inordinatus]
MSALTVRIDPHVHSEASYDGSDPVELILEQAAEIGLDAVVITDHDVIHESVRAAELAPMYGLVGIPGVEVSTADGHLLALGVESMPPRGEPLGETVEWIRDHGGVAIVPHPFQRSRHGVRKSQLTDADAIEVYNSWLFTGWKNRRARRFAREYGYPGVAGSDAHKVGYVGRAYTEIDVPDVTRATLTARDVLDAIYHGTTRVEGRRTPIPTSTRHYGGAAARKSGYYAKVGAIKSGSLAKASVVQAARTIARAGPFSR